MKVIARISTLLGKITIAIFCLTLPAHGKYGGGTGEPNEPYLIFDANQMNAIGADANDWHKHFKLMADIDLGQFTGTEFNIIEGFPGVFDGNGHTISNFTYTSPDKNGGYLFGGVSGNNAEIKNLGLINPNIDMGTGWYVGSLVGALKGTITNCYVEGGTVSGSCGVGGLVVQNWGEITNCYATCSVSGTCEGVSGLVVDNFGTITNCYSTGDVNGYSKVGGLVGKNYGSISNCYSNSFVSGGDWFVGGLVGDNYEGSISNCYSTGDVNGVDDVGGMVGGNNGSVSNCYSTGDVSGYRCVGGLVGYNDEGSIYNCCSTGDVSGDDYIGGMVGGNSSGISNCYSTGNVSGNWNVGGLAGGNFDSISNCFWDTDKQTNGVTESIGYNQGTVTNVYGLPTYKMQKRSTFTDTGWDFINVWNIGENQTYPYLRTFLAGDINNDGIVNFLDLSITANQWMEEQ